MNPNECDAQQIPINELTDSEPFLTQDPPCSLMFRYEGTHLRLSSVPTFCIQREKLWLLASRGGTDVAKHRSPHPMPI
jgi:hypothetical protein